MDLNIPIIPTDYFVGTLNQITEFYKVLKDEISIRCYLPMEQIELIGNGVIYPGGIEIKENDERTFSEIGIRSNFNFKLSSKKSRSKNK